METKALETSLLSDLTVAYSRWIILKMINNHNDSDLVLFYTRIKKVDKIKNKFKSLNLIHGGEYVVLEINSFFTIGETIFPGSSKIVTPNFNGYFVFMKNVLVESFVYWDIINFYINIDHPEILRFREVNYDFQSRIFKKDTLLSISVIDEEFSSFSKDISKRINDHYVCA